MGTSQIHPAWDLVDAIAIINLDSCPERMEVFRAENEGRISMDKLHRISAVYGRDLPGYAQAPWFMPRTMERAPYWGGAAGCVLSHRKAIETAREKGWRNVLIVEDDVEIGTDSEGLELLEKTLRDLTGPFMLYLGYSRPVPYGRLVQAVGEHKLWQIEGVLSTYAYLISQELYDSVLAALPTQDTIWDWLSRYRAIDTFYRDQVANMSGVRVYTIQPDLVEHKDGESSIGGAVTWQNRYSRDREPYSYASLAGWWHLLSYPFRRLKIYLNSCRTHRRALRGGFPGYKKKKNN